MQEPKIGDLCWNGSYWWKYLGNDRFVRAYRDYNKLNKDMKTEESTTSRDWIKEIQLFKRESWKEVIEQ